LDIPKINIKMKHIILLAVSLVFVSCQWFCCTPTQWEGEAAGFSRRNNETFHEYISYDFANRRMRIDIFERIYEKDEIKRLSKTVIEREVQGMTYIYDIFPNGTCFYHNPQHSVQQMCVRADFSHKYDYTIGGTLEVSLFVYQHDEYQEDLVFTRQKCLPVSGYYMMHHERQRPTLEFDVNFWNIQLGIRNPNIFNPPGNCAPRAENLE